MKRVRLEADRLKADNLALASSSRPSLLKQATSKTIRIAIEDADVSAGLQVLELLDAVRTHERDAVSLRSRKRSLA